MIPWMMILDATVIVVVLCGIVYAIKLQRLVSLLRESRHDMHHSLQKFSDDTLMAEELLKNLQANSDRSMEELTLLIWQGEPLKRQLMALLQQGEGLGKRLDEKIYWSRLHLGQSPKSASEHSAKQEQKHILSRKENSVSGRTATSGQTNSLRQQLMEDLTRLDE